VSGNQIDLAWADNSGDETGFKIERSPDGSTFAQIATVGANVTSFSDTGLNAFTTYYYRGRASNGNGNSAYTNTARATTFAGPPSPPTGLTATAGDGQVALTWTAAGGADSYTVNRRTVGGSGYAPLAIGVTGTDYVDAGLTNGTAYSYVVTAVNAAGESAPSNEASATPVAGPPPDIRFEEIRTGGSTSSATVATALPLLGVLNHLYIAAVTVKPGNVSVREVNGLGLTWTLVRAQCSGRNRTRMEVWKALGTPNGSSVVTATLSGKPLNAVIEVTRYSCVNATAPVGSVVSANTRGVNGVCSGGTDRVAYSVNLTTTAPNALAYGAVAIRSWTHTPGSGYTEQGEKHQGSGGDAAGAAVEDKKVTTPTSVAVNGTFSSSVDWAAVAIELRP